MKKILILSYFFPPMGGGGVLRMLSFARYLPTFGWEPHIVTVKEISHYFNDPSLLKDLDENTTIYRSGSLDFFRLHHFLRGGSGGSRMIKPVTGNFQGLSHLLFIPDNRIGWYPFALMKSRKLIEKMSFDAIISSSPPNTSHLIAYRLNKETKIPWIADFRDLWVDNPNIPVYTPLHLFVHNYLERKVLKNANLISVVSPAYKENFLRRHSYLNPDKIIYLPNGYNEELFPQKRDLPDKFVITHTGIFSGNRRPDTFLRACSYLKEIMGEDGEIIKDLRINFIGPGSLSVRNVVKKYGLENIVNYKENVSQNEAISYLLQSVINLLIVSIESGHDAVIPSKLFEYLATRNPIIALCGEDSEVEKIIHETGSGKVVRADDFRAIADILKQYYYMFKDGKLPETQLPLIERYSRRYQAKQFSEILNNNI